MPPGCTSSRFRRACGGSLSSWARPTDPATSTRPRATRNDVRCFRICNMLILPPCVLVLAKQGAFSPRLQSLAFAGKWDGNEFLDEFARRRFVQPNHAVKARGGHDILCRMKRYRVHGPLFAFQAHQQLAVVHLVN